MNFLFFESITQKLNHYFLFFGTMSFFCMKPQLNQTWISGSRHLKIDTEFIIRDIKNYFDHT